MHTHLTIKGAREHNLKNLSLSIPRDQLVVITGLSGSGKSSLAFDTIYAEGQRRYVESLSAYARQFLGLMEKPDVDQIDGLSPAISIDQKTVSKNPRSTVGTVTEIYDYLRLLFAHTGQQFCHSCHAPIRRMSLQEMTDWVEGHLSGKKILVLAPMIRGRKGTYEAQFKQWSAQGFVRLRVNGEIRRLDEDIKLDRYKAHDLDLVIDRLEVNPENRARLAESLESACKLAEGRALVSAPEQGPKGKDLDQLLTEGGGVCSACGTGGFETLEPRFFSFNSPYGACPQCDGLGVDLTVDEDLIVPDPELSIDEKCFAPFSGWANSYFQVMIRRAAAQLGIPLTRAWADIDPTRRQQLLYGRGEETLHINFNTATGRRRSVSVPFHGIIPMFSKSYRESDSNAVREELEPYLAEKDCQACNGGRLKPQHLAVKVGDANMATLCAMPIRDSLHYFEHLPHKLDDRRNRIARDILREICNRLLFLSDVGLDYLTLNRKSGTLSGGESQRIRLASQLGSALTGVLYVLDEPSIGLHARDNTRLIQTLEKLRDQGNSVVVVEHDEEMIQKADWVLDLGPGAGEHGGEIVAEGPPATIHQSPNSLTGRYLRGEVQVPYTRGSRKGNGEKMTLQGAKLNNLQGISVNIPLGNLTVVTGVSGSGKSTLVNDVLFENLHRYFRSVSGELRMQRGATLRGVKAFKGIENLDRYILVDQSPIGRTPRSNPATYVKVFDHIRDLFSMTKESKMRGWSPGRFSFNVKGGRCESCSGDGMKKIEMHFLPDVYIPCEVCKGKRYNRETLTVHYKHKTIADVLAMSVTQALDHFVDIPPIVQRLKTLEDVGLGYLRLGQPATTLSGGEAQRVKLALELSKRATGKTLYILDEPTTGLHFEDVRKLLMVLNRLVDQGNTVVVIEHNMDVIKQADWLIDLGPEGGDGGGHLVYQGPREGLLQVPGSYTAKYLRDYLAHHHPKDLPLSAKAEEPKASRLKMVKSPASDPVVTTSNVFTLPQRRGALKAAESAEMAFNAEPLPKKKKDFIKAPKKAKKT